MKFIFFVLLLHSVSCFSMKVFLIHGNGENKQFWFQDEQSLGNKLTEVFGEDNIHSVTYLGHLQQGFPLGNYHKDQYYEDISSLFEQVPFDEKVTVIAHSLGVTVALAAIEYYGLWYKVKNFIALAGAINGLEACKLYGTANPMYPTCAGQNPNDRYTFGFYPGTKTHLNDWTDQTSPYSFYKFPLKYPATQFISYSIGTRDNIICQYYRLFPQCTHSTHFQEADNTENIFLEEDELTHMTLPSSPSVFEKVISINE